MIRHFLRLFSRSILLCALTSLMLCSAWAEPTLRLDPPSPIFGKPLSIIILLDDEETTLSGLPDLGTFEPLAPPLQSGKEIRLVVLPMRPGEREIPSFPLQIGTAEQIGTAPLKVKVLEGIALDATIAPLKRRPFPLVGSGPGGWILAGVILFIVSFASIFLLWRWWQRPNFFKLPLAMQLLQLEARLRRLPPSAEQRRLLIEVEERRFAPVISTPDDLFRLYRQILSLQTEET